MTSDKANVLLGTLDLLVLKILGMGPMHGWGLSERLEAITDGVFCVNQGSLYPALQRLKRKGRVRSRWRMTENGRRARYYELTVVGERQLADELANWFRTCDAITKVVSYGT